MVGKSREEILGKDDRTLFPAAQAEQLLDTHRRILATGVTKSGEEVLHTVNGERVYLAVKGPLRGANGRIFGTYGISSDITDRNRAEAQLEDSQIRLRLLVDHAPAALAIFDRDMRFLEVSKRWRDDYVLRDTEIIGRSHYEVHPEARVLEIPASTRAGRRNPLRQ